MNVGIVTAWYECGAGYVSRQYSELLSPDFNVFIFARGGWGSGVREPNWDCENTTWANQFPIPMSTVFNKRMFLEWISNNKIDIVLFNEQSWWLPVLWCKELNVMCGAYIDYYTEETIPLFAAYDFLLCNTKRHYEAFNWHSNAHYLPWGTNIELFSPSHKNNENQSKDGISFFHSAGNAPERKGTDLLIKAFSQIEGDKRLIIHSQVNLHNRIPMQKTMMKDLISRGELQIINETVSAPGLYHLGDVYVYPSRLDGLGLTIVEAISCGLPTIVSDSQPMNEFITEATGKTVSVDKFYARADGYYWPQSDVSITDLSAKMKWYIDRAENIRVLKRNARTYAVTHFDWKNNRSNLTQIFKEAKFSFNQTSLDRIYKFELNRSRRHLAIMIFRRWPRIYEWLAINISKVLGNPSYKGI